MDAFAQDLRFALRRLLKAPGFTGVVLLTLALGIGANTAIFSVVHAVLWRPLFSGADRSVLLLRTDDGELKTNLSPANFFDLRARTRTLAAAGAFFTGGNAGTFTLMGQGDPVVITATHVTDGFFDVLQAPALYGRTLRPVDNQPGQHRVVVLGHALWRERFGSSPGIVGQSIVLDGDPYVVVGVMPPQVSPALRHVWGQVWVPFEYSQDFLDERDSHWLKGIARIASGQSTDAVQREIETIGRQLEAEYRENRNTGVTARPLHAYAVEDIRTAMLLLLGAVGFVLLIACANVANLVLARTVHREGEIAIRAALGGSRARLLRQLLTESLLLAVGGGLLGLLLAVWAQELLIRIRPADLLVFDAEIDPAVLLFTGVITMVTGVVVGCMPAWQATRVSLAGSLKQGGRGASGGVTVNRLRGALIVSEMALAVLLLTGAGLLIRSFINLQQVDPGFEADRVLSFRLSLPDRTYDTASRVAFFDGLLARLRASAGVESAAAINETPMEGGELAFGFSVAGRPEPRPGEKPSMEVRLVTPDYFETIRIPLRRGRVFTDVDVEGSRRALVLSESAVRRYFPNDDPIGQQIAFGWGPGEVIGVVGDVKEMGLSEPAEPLMYAAFAQVPRRSTMSVLLRTAIPPMSVANTVREAVRESDPTLAISELQTLDGVLADSTSQSRFYLVLLGTFAAAALLLAAIGIFGVMSNAVAHRTREIGIRLTLGAHGSQVRHLVLRTAFLLAGLGIALGLLASVLLTRLLASLLFEVTPTDPLTVVGVVAVLLCVALLASYLPARRASRVDPVVALRAE